MAVPCRTLWGVFVIALWGGVLCLPTIVWGASRFHKKKMSRAEVKASIQAVHQQYVTKRLRTDKHLHMLRHREGQLRLRLRHGICKDVTLPIPVTHCHQHCVAWLPRTKRVCRRFRVKIGPVHVNKTKCFSIPDGMRCASHKRLCVPSLHRQRVRLCAQQSGQGMSLTVNGRLDLVKQAKKWAASTCRSLRSQWNKAKRDVDVAAQETSRTAKAVGHAASHAFLSMMGSLRKKARAIAKKLAPLYHKRLNRKISAALGKAILKASKLYFKKSGRAMIKALAKGDRTEVESLLHQQQLERDASGTFDWTTLVAMGLTVGVYAAKVTLDCWLYKGPAKKVCLNDKIAIASRDATFDLTELVLQTVLDATVIEPISQELAIEVAGGLAAVTEGVGALAYPIAYSVSSVTMNLTFSLVFETMRQPYRYLYDKTAGRGIRALSRKVVATIPNKYFKCLAPAALCKRAYTQNTHHTD